MTATAPSPVLFRELLDQLRVEGFQLDIDHYVDVQRVIDRLGPDLKPEELCSHIAPVVVRNREEQDRFYAAFRRLYPFFAAQTSQPQTTADYPAHPLTHDEDTYRARKSGFRRRTISFAAVAVVVAAGFVLTVLMRGPESAQEQGVDQTPPVVEQPSLEQPADDVVPQPAPGNDPSPISWLVIGLPIVVLLLTEVWKYRRRHLAIERTKVRRPPFEWPLRVSGSPLGFFGSHAFRRAAASLRAREESETQQFAADEAITATIEAGGHPEPRYRSGTRPPEYLILMERTAWRDHQATLFEHIVDAMEREGVHVTAYFFDRDPRICTDATTNEARRLVDLRARYPLHRLLVFGTGEGLVDPISGKLHEWTRSLFDWPHRALLTPTSPAAWGVGEIRIASHFLVLPCSVAGLNVIVDQFELSAESPFEQWRDSDSHTRVPLRSSTVGDLRRYLGESCFRWFAACALYPELHWDVTLLLGAMPAVGEGLLTEENLLRLIRLEYFRQGTIPDELRLELTKTLDRTTERAVRREIVRVLEEASPPEGTVAAEKIGLQLAVQRLFASRRERSERRRQLRTITHVPHSEIQRDVALVRLLERLPRSPLTLLLPRALRNRFYQHGIPAFGLRTATRVGFAAAVTSGLLVTAGLWRPALNNSLWHPVRDPIAIVAPPDTTPSIPVVTQPIVADLALDPGFATLEVGESLLLSPVARDSTGRIVDDATIEWASSNTSIATISATGIATAFAPGSTLVTARAGTRAVSVAVVVRAAVQSAVPVDAPPTERTVARVTVSPSAMTVVRGREFRFSALATDDSGHILTGRGVRWESEDTNIASVDSAGVVYGKAPGTTAITAIIEGRSGVGSVTVEAEPARIVTTPARLTLTVGQSAPVRAEVQTPAGSRIASPVSWTSSNPSVARVTESGLVVGVSSGTTTILATAVDVSTSVSVSVEPAVEAPEPDPVDRARVEIDATIRAYGQAIESRDLGAIRAVFPEIPGDDANRFVLFFQSVSDLDVSVNITDLTVIDNRAEARVDFTYTFRTSRMEQQNSATNLILERRNGTWVIVHSGA